MPNSNSGTMWRTRLGWLAAGGVVSAGIRGAHDNTKLGSLLVDPYWVGFYVTNFQDGFRRRALIGTLCRVLQPHGMSVVVINMLAVAALAGVLALFVRSFTHLADVHAPRASLFAFALFGSALASVFFEVLGDTLQIAFLVFLLFAALPATRLTSHALRLALALIGLVLAFFVHEASAFLLAPCIPFLVGARVRVRDFIFPVATLFGLVLLSVHWSHLNTHLTYHAISIPRGMSLEELAATPSFVELLRLERVDDFSSRSKVIFFLIKCASIAGLALAGVVAAANCFSGVGLRRFLTSLTAILLVSSPLWVIAHDWGRFLGYTFFLASLAAWAGTTRDLGIVPWLETRLGGWAARIGQNEAFQCAALLLLLVSPYDQSRIFGMHIRDFLSSLFTLAVGAAWLWKQRDNASSVERAGQQPSNV